MLYQDSLRSSLASMSTNGMRTLVCSYADLPCDWWVSRAKLYDAAVNADTTPYSKGHDGGNCQTAQCEKCAMHNLFEQFEVEANMAYLGLVGMEDRLSDLVPESIQDYLKADIKVWMITGDKLDAAKTIGLACNLIDPDMLPEVNEGDDIVKVAAAFKQSRLIQVTGEWADISSREEELMKLFDAMDTTRTGTLSIEDLTFCLDALCYAPIGQQKLASIFVQAGKTGSSSVSKAEFVAWMQESSPSMYDCVRYDIKVGWELYHSIEDHQEFPVSLLVSRDAFLVMFPEGEIKKDGEEKEAEVVTGESKKKEKQAMSEKQMDLEVLREQFFALTAVAKSVVFARAKPAHKKKMVTEIKARVPGVITLAIGDGANDTDMIKAAHVGVGISGVEGTAAVNSADYAIGTFRMLHTLLFVHGFWSYNRMSRMVVFIFYKASLTSMCMFAFGYFSGYSGQQYFNDPIYQLYNIFYTSLPVMFLGVLDQPLDKRTLQNMPLAYTYQRRAIFTNAFFWGWVFRSLAHGLLCFAIPVLLLADQDIESEGDIRGLWFVSTTSFFAASLAPSFLILLLMTSVSALHKITIIVSIGAVFFFVPILNMFIELNPNLYGVVNHMFHSSMFWLTLIITLSIIVLSEMAWQFICRFHPSVTEVLQERNSAAFKALPKEEQDKCKLTRKPIPLPKKKPLPKKQLAAHERRKSISMDQKSGHDLKTAAIRAMLRFRALTGSQWDYANIAPGLMNLDPMVGSSESTNSSSGSTNDKAGSKMEVRRILGVSQAFLEERKNADRANLEAARVHERSVHLSCILSMHSLSFLFVSLFPLFVRRAFVLLLSLLFLC